MLQRHRADDQEVELLELNRQGAIYKNQKRDLPVAVLDSANLGSIFGLYLADVGKQFLENIGHYFMFPFAAAAALLRTYFAWKDKQLNNGKNGTTRKLALEVVSAVAITAAVVGSFLWSSISTMISPIIFTAVLAVKSLFHGVSAIYYAWKARKANKLADSIGEDGDQLAKRDAQAEAARCSKLAKANAVGFVAGIFATAAVALVMIIAKPLLITIGAIAGVVAGAIGAIYSAWNYKSLKKPAEAGSAEESLLNPNEIPSDVPAPGRSPRHSPRGHGPIPAMLRPAGDLVIGNGDPLVPPTVTVADAGDSAARMGRPMSPSRLSSDRNSMVAHIGSGSHSAGTTTATAAMLGAGEQGQPQLHDSPRVAALLAQI